MKRIASNILMAFLGALLALMVAAPFANKEKGAKTDALPQLLMVPTLSESDAPNTSGIAQKRAAVRTPATASKLDGRHYFDFTSVAARTMPAVVHIRTLASTGNNPLREWFGGNGSEQSLSSGSGVIVNSQGYIVTNHHVVEGAGALEVVLHDRRTFRAETVALDPSTDLAVIKIDETNLPVIPYGNSDEVNIGEWVMAVGNPFNLSSTVTTGIVSAKARNIDILQDRLAIESFIQTDAAVNPGNSGGALVSLDGELIGINTAIATPTGYFAGYSFAVPVNIVRKVVEDMLEFGEVRRGFLGVAIRDVTDELAQRANLNKIEGVFITDVSVNGAADKAGILPGDIILKVENTAVNSAPELQEAVSRYRPGDKVALLINRDGKNKKVDVILKGKF